MKKPKFICTIVVFIAISLGVILFFSMGCIIMPNLNNIYFIKSFKKQYETPRIVLNIISKKKNISEQLILLRRNRNIPEVQEYIDTIYNFEYTTDYVKYLIDRYYYGINGLTKPKKDAVERLHKVILR